MFLCYSLLKSDGLKKIFTNCWSFSFAFAIDGECQYISKLKKAGSTLTRSRNRSPWRTETSDTTACSYCLPWTTFIVVDLGKKRRQYQSFGLLSRTIEAKIPLKCWREHQPSWYSADPEVSLPAFCGNRLPCWDAFSWLHGLSLPSPPGHPCWGLI